MNTSLYWICRVRALAEADPSLLPKKSSTHSHSHTHTFSREMENATPKAADIFAATVSIDAVGVGPGTGDVDANGDGFIDGELTTGTNPKEEDSDGDLLKDGLEVANGADPLDPFSYPILADGDVAPYGEPDGQLNVGDLAVAIRVALGIVDTRTLELAHCDLGVPDGIINSADILLLIQMLQSPPSP